MKWACRVMSDDIDVSFGSVTVSIGCQGFPSGVFSAIVVLCTGHDLKVVGHPMKSSIQKIWQEIECVSRIYLAANQEMMVQTHFVSHFEQEKLTVTYKEHLILEHDPTNHFLGRGLHTGKYSLSLGRSIFRKLFPRNFILCVRWCWSNVSCIAFFKKFGLKCLGGWLV